jgi:hypothetical protein
MRTRSVSTSPQSKYKSHDAIIVFVARLVSRPGYWLSWLKCFQEPLQATAGIVAKVGRGHVLPNILFNLTFIHDPANRLRLFKFLNHGASQLTSRHYKTQRVTSVFCGVVARFQYIRSNEIQNSGGNQGEQHNKYTTIRQDTQTGGYV